MVHIRPRGDQGVDQPQAHRLACHAGLSREVLMLIGRAEQTGIAEGRVSVRIGSTESRPNYDPSINHRKLGSGDGNHEGSQSSPHVVYVRPLRSQRVHRSHFPSTAGPKQLLAEPLAPRLLLLGDAVRLVRPPVLALAVVVAVLEQASTAAEDHGRGFAPLAAVAHVRQLQLPRGCPRPCL